MRDIGFAVDTLVLDETVQESELEVLFSLVNTDLQGLILSKPAGIKTPFWDKLSKSTEVIRVSDDHTKKAEIKAVHVPDFKGKGMETVQGMIQNLAEAEYVVALYMYHRLKSHSVKDSKVETKPLNVLIVTTEEGQRRLIESLLRQKCAWHPLLGMPETPVSLSTELIDSLEFDLALVSTVWTSLHAPGLIERSSLSFI